MTSLVIADAGVIVAFLDRREHLHRWAAEQIRSLPKPFLTCEPVINEACYLMRPSPNGELDVLALIETGLLAIGFSLSNELKPVTSLMKKYIDIPMSLADGCMVRMSELHDEARVCTLDSDFRVYRKNRNQIVPLIMPDDL